LASGQRRPLAILVIVEVIARGVVARMQTLAINIDKARGRVPDAIRQAYCIVVTVSDKDEVQAFKITVNEDPHFEIIKNDTRSRVQDTAITAEALLPDGPYNLWKGGETSRRVKDLAGAFAQLPHLPKMLKAQAIVETLVGGCVQGTFVLKLMRPDRTFRTWWRSQPDEAALADPALELVLPEAAELGEIPPRISSPTANRAAICFRRWTVVDGRHVDFMDGSRQGWMAASIVAPIPPPARTHNNSPTIRGEDQFG